ncbi:hypothetical protein QUB56_09015 [Microcoleus sp. AR_TQ3_B6]|uniref:hypothetical protein n=1 Tax=Microcoleus sp. AR_TQ3_B6 TaxID=3055284 RepID=UPI002FD40136
MRHQEHETMTVVQLTETGDRTSRWTPAIVPNASLASFAVSVALEEERLLKCIRFGAWEISVF